MTEAPPAHQVVATRNPISPSAAPVQAPTRVAVLILRPRGTGCSGAAGSGS